MPLVLADNLLQKDDIGIENPQVFAQLMHHHAPLEMGKSFVNIISGNMQLKRHVMDGRFRERDCPEVRDSGPGGREKPVPR
jgi:hypothetical protein